MTGFQLAWITLSRRRFQTVFAIVGVAVACLAADTLVTVVRGQTSSLQNLSSDYDLVVGPKSSGSEVLLGALGHAPSPEDPIPFALVRYLDRRADLIHRVPIYAFGNHREHPLIGVDLNYWERPEGFETPHLAAGALWEATDEVVVGTRAAAELELKVGDTLNLNLAPEDPEEPGDSWSAEFTVVGIAKHPDPIRDRNLIFPIEAAWRYYRWKVDRGLEAELKDREAVSYILVSADPVQFEFVENKIHEGSTVQVVRVEEEIAFLENLVGAVNHVTQLLSLLVFLLAALAVAVLVNTRFDSIKPELGVLRALGYTRGEIATWVTLESLIPVAVAVAATVVVEALLFPMTRSILSVGPWVSEVEWPATWNFFMWGLFLALSVLASAIPILRLYRTDIHRSMEGA